MVSRRNAQFSTQRSARRCSREKKIRDETVRYCSTKAYRMSYVLNILQTNEIKYSEYIPVFMYSTIYERTRYVLVEQVDPTKEVSKN